MRHLRNRTSHSFKIGWYANRRHRNAQLVQNCMDELSVIADYRRSQEAELLDLTDV